MKPTRPLGRLGVVACAVLLFLAAGAGAGESGGSTAGEFLRLGMGARAPALGDAMTAGAEGAISVHYNPAALAWSDRKEIDVMYQSIVLGIGQGTLGYAQPFGPSGGIGAGLTYLDYGSTTRTTITDGAAPTFATAGTFDGSDLAAGISYGRRFDNVGVGVTLKGISSSIDNASATAFAADFGLLYRPNGWLRLGATVQNVGTQLKFDRTNEDLPLLVRGGAAASLWDNRLRLFAEGEKARDDDALFMGGAEYWVADILALRAGYDGRLAGVDNGLTAGLGVRWHQMAVDYSYIPFGKIGENHRVGLRVEFGGPTGEDWP